MVNVVKATMERRRKRGRPSKKRRDEFEDDLNIMGIKTGQEMATDHWEWRKIILVAKFCNGQKKKKKNKE
jgi:hypothetical protein